MQMGVDLHRKMAEGAYGASWDQNRANSRKTPQGGVISPILSNLFLHYTFDLWMKRTHPDLPWCRYADDRLVHCRTEQEAEALKAELRARLAEYHLELHPELDSIRGTTGRWI